MTSQNATSEFTSLIVYYLLTLSLLKIIGQVVFDLFRGYSVYRNEIKSPVSFPILANAPQVLLNYNSLNDYIVELSTLFQHKVLSLKVPFAPRYLITNDPNNIEYVLKSNFSNYHKGSIFHQNTSVLLGNGIFNVDGNLWSRLRKVSSHLFTVSNFRNYIGNVFQYEILTLCEVIDGLIEQNPNKAFDLHDLFHRYTLDSIMKIGFGFDLGSLKLEDGVSVRFSKAFNRAQSIINRRFLNPLWPITEVLDGTSNLLSSDIQVLDDLVYKIIKQRRKDIENNVFVEANDFLSQFLTRGHDSDNELRDVVMNMIIAGRDTTAQALSWCFFELLQHPEVIERMRSEIEQVMKENEIPSYDQQKEMLYCKAVFQETLRLHPSVPKQIKMAMQNDKLPDGTIILAGDWVTYSSYALGRNPDVWGKACNHFDPSRFLSDPSPSPFKFIAFNAGPRLCLGMNMAYMEGVMALSTLIRRYDFTLAMNLKDVKYNTSLTLPMKSGFFVKAIKRSS